MIVGLGNIGEKYAKTRHNIGFQAVDDLAEKKGIPFRDMKRLFAQVAKDADFILVKPTTFMNESGKAVRAVCDYFDLDPQTQLVVIHDDLDLPLGVVKKQQGTGPKVHNGLNSLYQHLGTKNFAHIRLGIDGRNGVRNIPGAEYVLTRFLPEENFQVERMIEVTTQLLLSTE